MPRRRTGVKHRKPTLRRRAGVTILVMVAVAGGAGAAYGLLTSDGPQVALADDTATTSTTATTAPEPTTTTAPPTTTTAPPPPPEPEGLRPGAAGDEVVALQTSLDALGFWLGDVDGTYAALTQQAVLAFQKANGLSRDGIAGPDTMAALAVATRPAPGALADGIEIDLERQLLLVVQGGTVTHVLNTSTGRSGWRTPPGDFTMERQIDGMRHAPLGDLYRPKYFNGGIAVHGATSIPGQPASHGCARVSFTAMDMLWSSGLAEIGTRVVVY